MIRLKSTQVVLGNYINTNATGLRFVWPHLGLDPSVRCWVLKFSILLYLYELVWLEYLNIHNCKSNIWINNLRFRRYHIYQSNLQEIEFYIDI